MIRKFYDSFADNGGCNQDQDQVQFIPYQLCPKCHGQGIVEKPPYVPGDVDQWISADTAHQCDVCMGAKIIPQYIVPIIKF